MWYLSILLFISCLISASCQAPATEVVDVTNASMPLPVATESEPPSDEQMTMWEEKSVQPLIRRWLAGENLDGQFVDLDWGEGMEWAAYNQKQAKVALLDVDDDGRQELGFQTACAPVGNCLFHIYRREGNGFAQIGSASMVQTFKLRKTKTNGLFDLETRAHDSAISGGIAVYKFDGKEYVISECFGYEYKVTGETDRNGQSIVADKPTLTKADCTGWTVE
ncbi:MAG: hypothetical protein PSX80_02335 [bacterium]|nr:hypothetical protein [bacterium]